MTIVRTELRRNERIGALQMFASSLFFSRPHMQTVNYTSVICQLYHISCAIYERSHACTASCAKSIFELHQKLILQFFVF